MQIKGDLTQRDIEAYQDAVAEMSGAVISRDPSAIVASLTLFHREVVKEKPTAEQYRELSQRFMDAERERVGKLTSSAQNRIIVLAAIRAGILDDVDAATLGDKTPGYVMRTAKAVIDAVGAAFEVPGE